MILSQFYGAGNRQGIRNALHTGMALSLLLCARMGHTLMWIIIKGITCAAATALLYTLALGRTAEYRWMLEKGRSFLRKWRKKA